MKPDRISDRSWVEIDLSSFRQNLRALKAFLAPDQGFIQIVKADAYGHGAAEISRVALAEGAAALGVANLDEGKLLRIQGCKAPILILSPALENELGGILDYSLTPTLSDLGMAQKLSSLAASRNSVASVQLKLDSGMHRSGAVEKDFAALWEGCRKLPDLKVEGIFSHFAASESDPDFSRQQEEAFLRILNKHGLNPRQAHLANSSALVNGLGRQFGLCRLGILSYGVFTHPHQCARIGLKPVMTFKSRVVQLKDLPKGSRVGYNLIWQATRRTRCAIIPVGYADGYDFLLSNRGTVSINGKLCPVIGRVSMDMLSVDVTDLKELRPGEEVILLGGTDPELRVENLSARFSGSPYELLCQVGRRAKRYFYDRGKLVTSAPLARREFVSSDYPDSQLNQIIQSAIAQRINSEEMGELISREILRVFFYNKDREILYRRYFAHSIRLEECGSASHWRAITTLSFVKTLQNDFFTVACANTEQALKEYFLRRDVEYRWLMDGNFAIGPQTFQLSSVRINRLKLSTSIHFRHSCMEIRCSHPRLKSLVGSEVRFRIDTETLYPKNSHQLSVFITELTRGVKIGFIHPGALARIECIPVFAGQNKFPRVSVTQDSVRIATKPGEWVFPRSGVVFAY